MSEDINQIEVNNAAFLERQFYSLLQSLPKELGDKWENELDELPEINEAFLAKFKEFCLAREAALDSSLEIQANVILEILEEIVAVKKVIRDTFGDPHYFLGNGYTAEVYELPIAPHLCVKYIHNQKAYNENNHLRAEFAFLSDLHGFEVSGVRTPIPYFIRIHPSEGHSYGMEKIQGKNLSQILERPGDNQELIATAKKLNHKTATANLLSYIESLHLKYNITHGDLFQRNIMLDEEGNFYIIDFGKAKVEEVGEDHESRRKSDLATLRSEVGIFFEAIDRLELN